MSFHFPTLQENQDNRAWMLCSFLRHFLIFLSCSFNRCSISVKYEKHKIKNYNQNYNNSDDGGDNIVIHSINKKNNNLCFSW